MKSVSCRSSTARPRSSTAAPCGSRSSTRGPTRARLRILPTPPAGLAKGVRPQFDARLEQIETGRVINLAPLGFEQALEAKCLPPGPYRVDIGAPGLGWTGAKVVIDGRGLWNIGRLHFAASGRVRFDERLATSPFDSMHAFYRRTEAVDVQVEPTRVEGDSVLLPPDDYVLLWRDGAAAALARVPRAERRRDGVALTQPRSTTWPPQFRGEAAPPSAAGPGLLRGRWHPCLALQSRRSPAPC